MLRSLYVVVLSILTIAPFAFSAESHLSETPISSGRQVSTAPKFDVSSKSLHDYVTTNSSQIKNWIDQGHFATNHYSATVATISGHDLITPEARKCAREQLGANLETFSLPQVMSVLNLVQTMPVSTCSQQLQTSLNEAASWIVARETQALAAMRTPTVVSETGGFVAQADVCFQVECSPFFGRPLFPFVNPAGQGYYGIGRFPLQPFFTPLRPWGGITPVRQFLFGRGRERRLNRRACLFGGC